MNILDMKNYGDLEHKCSGCTASKDENDFCDITMHDNRCLQKVPPTTKVSYTI